MILTQVKHESRIILTHGLQLEKGSYNTSEYVCYFTNQTIKVITVSYLVCFAKLLRREAFHHHPHSVVDREVH